jgi:antitoxin component of MazEF toxin-antitoxin module
MYNSIELTVRKWGNSLGIRIPKRIAELMSVEEGTKLRMTFTKNHVELKVSDEELVIQTPVRPAGPHQHFSRTFKAPDYTSKPRGRRTPLNLTDQNFESMMKKHPFVVVLFLDYMYLDFYDRIEERLVKLRELAEVYSGYVWFGSARIEKNELARERYVGNVWGEEEVRGFVNGKLAFKSGRLADVEDVISRILPNETFDTIKKRKKHSAPIIANIKNFNAILAENEYVVAGFFPPGEREGVAIFNELARSFTDTVTFTLTTDRVLFNEKSRTFYRNPLFERFTIVEEREVILFNRGNVMKRLSMEDQEDLKHNIELYLSQGKGA